MDGGRSKHLMGTLEIPRLSIIYIFLFLFSFLYGKTFTTITPLTFHRPWVEATGMAPTPGNPISTNRGSLCPLISRPSDSSDKGQLISKGLFGILNSSKKRTKKFDLTTMIPQVDLFSFVFWKNLKTPKRHFEIN